jgi:peptidoglycan/xylan/chitin deacetylase (PgdA/CDA1 family)
MKIYLTLDYELFLGADTGSVELCLIKPMEYLCAMADKYRVKFTIFVDAAYLCALKRFIKYQQINRDYNIVVQHLSFLKQKGHSIALHLHPHWFYAEYNGNDWIAPSGHYKLSDIPLEEVYNIIAESKSLLEEIINTRVSAFRAGGFSIQPFELYAKIFEDLGLNIDSSVLCGMQYNSDNQQYDYRNAPQKDSYPFSKDICKEDNKGPFREYPVSTHGISPLFWWKLSMRKILRLKSHKNLGDGKSIETTSQSIISRLTRPQMGFACMDGYKSSQLFKMREQHLKRFGQEAHFLIIGHPKLTTLYSLKILERVIMKYINYDNFVTLK